jgi:GGDEF domain-containing protein
MSEERRLSPTVDQAVTAIDLLTDRAEQELFSAADLRERLAHLLRDAALHGLLAAVRVEADGQSVFDAGGSLSGEVDHRSCHLGTDFELQTTVSRHRLATRMNDTLLRLGKAVWGRTRKGYHLASADDVLPQIGRTIGRTLADDKDVVFVTLDLDGLGAARTEHRTPAAEDLVAGFARRVFDKFQETAVPLHLHGDEFGIYFYDVPLVDVAISLDQFLRALIQTPLKTEAGELAISAKASVVSAKLHGIGLIEASYVNEGQLKRVAIEARCCWENLGSGVYPNVLENVLEAWFMERIAEPTVGDLAALVTEGRRRFAIEVCDIPLEWFGEPSTTIIGHMHPLAVGRALLRAILRSVWLNRTSAFPSKTSFFLALGEPAANWAPVRLEISGASRAQQVILGMVRTAPMATDLPRSRNRAFTSSRIAAERIIEATALYGNPTKASTVRQIHWKCRTHRRLATWRGRTVMLIRPSASAFTTSSGTMAVMTRRLEATFWLTDWAKCSTRHCS